MSLSNRSTQHTERPPTLAIAHMLLHAVLMVHAALHLPCLLAQVYGKGMAEKILALAADFEKLEADATARKAQLQPLVDAERQRQQEAAAAAQREEEEQQRRCSPKIVRLENSWTGCYLMPILTSKSHGDCQWCHEGLLLFIV